MVFSLFLHLKHGERGFYFSLVYKKGVYFCVLFFPDVLSLYDCEKFWIDCLKAVSVLVLALVMEVL